MLVRRLATILPVMRLAEALETTQIHRVAGRTGAHTPRGPPFFCRPTRHPGAMGVGNGNSDSTIRGESHLNTISRAS